jgi:hypothetical protein
MKKYIYLVILLFTVLTGCKKSYLDINTNPNLPTEGSITPDLILPRALHATGVLTGASFASVARWMGYWTRGGDYGPSAEEESYNITTTFGTGVWSSWYNTLTDYDIMEKKANASGQKFYEGIAKTMKTVGFMYLVDTYDNVPYSKAFNLSANILPAYDKGADIYKDLFLQLDKALVLINSATPGVDTKIESADIMFHGSAASWRKFINTQRLRLVIRCSEVAIVNPVTELAKITSDGFLTTTAAVNPGYVKASNSAKLSQQNPFWDTYKRDLADVLLDRYNRANNYVLGIFKSTTDIRYQYYFDPAVTPLNGYTYWGYDYGFVDPNPDNPKSINSSGVAGPGLARSFTQDQWVLTSVESKFLQVEAAQRGWLTPPIGGTVKAMYQDAVKESFRWLGVTNADVTADTYINSGNAIVNWDAAAAGDKIKLIITQKYLGLVGISNYEAWADYRRTSFPAVPKSLAPSVGANIPVRYRYPISEYNYNAANVAAENNPNIFSAGVFWDR